MARAKTIFTPVEGVGRYSNLVQKQTYSLPFFELDPAADDDLVVYMRNLVSDPIEIFRITVVGAAAASVILLQKVTGTAGGSPTAILAVNRDVDSAEDYSNSIESVDDPDITGLTEVGTLDTFGVVAGGEATHNYPEGIILRQNSAVALGVGTGTCILSGSIAFRLLPEDFL